MWQERRYELQAQEANQQIQAILEGLQIPPDRRSFYAQLLTTVLKMYEDGADLGDLKITNSALKELRYAFKVFSLYRNHPKVTIFGSARTLPAAPISRQATHFAENMVKAGWMVVTGAGSGVMGAAQEGAGREASFGLNIRLPFEQEVNPWIAEDPKLIHFKYFFTRKLFFVKEASAVCLCPGGFGTFDEAFEVLTLVQTGKASIMPIVLLDVPGGEYWQHWEQFIRVQLLAQGLISPEDLDLFLITDDVEQAVEEIFAFYRLYHSARYVDDELVLRLRHPLPPQALPALEAAFADILRGSLAQQEGPLPGEGDEYPDLWRLRMPFIRARYGRLRKFIDAVNHWEELPQGMRPGREEHQDDVWRHGLAPDAAVAPPYRSGGG